MIEDKFMRVLLMFDVPTKSKKEQKLASKFRNNLIKLGILCCNLAFICVFARV